MSNKKAQPGDKVLITSMKSSDKQYQDFIGQTFTVVRCPDKYRDLPGRRNFVWVEFSPVPVVGIALVPPNYDIVGLQPDARTKDVDESLRQKMDDNLRNIFG